ncbi:MAG: type 12 methyltransferase [archaeon GW2011_AR17]|nr:MAG: type 12 methyltransferase [archaeon GW2011_AR17]MBS3154124.1 class I SAM-dependent methyltransferase [Candidatus Woesearchaeota archaeon]HIH14719.1 class I SAM-dependent methyltransferase [Nanoarchaeota archaeon]HIH59010.1 class I SAM-dependent methyltransferase [Nanoarchaeota archaeon]HII14398.1 class I SAM-dependent methyltransferase [Nanoarchaeota archaeon]
MKCNLCGSLETKKYVVFKEYTLMKCSSCGLLFTDQNSIQVKNMYSKDYFDGVHGNFFVDCKKGYESRIKGSGKLQNFQHILQKIKEIKPQGKFMDIGCATGVFLDMAQKEGYDVTGVDVSAFACQYTSENFGIKTLQGKLEDLHVEDKSFDIITMWDVIEHVPDPHAFLKEVNRVLKDDGIIFVLTINDSSLMGWLAEGIYVSSFKTIPTFTRMIHPIHHNYHFKEKHVQKYLDTNGFSFIWKEKSEMPAETIEGGAFVKNAARVLYFISGLTHLQHEIRVIAKKK